MNRTRVLLLALWAATSNAADTERVIKEMIRTSANIPEAEIRENYKAGCESPQTFAMRICARFRSVSAELDLNDTYLALRKKDSIPSSKQRLEAAQTAWMKFRDATCEYETNAWNGGMQGAMISGCRESLTKERQKVLEKYLRCTEPGCP